MKKVVTKRVPARQPPRRPVVIFLIASGLVVALLLVEFIGAVLYYGESGGWFYTRPATRLGNDDSGVIPSQRLTKSVLHPYLGFVFRPGLSLDRIADSKRVERLLAGHVGVPPPWTGWKTNNLGFIAPEDYPLPRQDSRDYVIGIFGGSVAQWFALQGAKRLGEVLASTPQLEDRKIKVLNFAQGGFKQPQQLQTLSYLLTLGQEFDLVVNLNGFNEIALALINSERNLDVSMPSAQHILPLRALAQANDPDTVEHVSALNRARSRVEQLERRMSSTWSAGAFMILSALRERARNDMADRVRSLESTAKLSAPNSLVSLLPATSDRGVPVVERAFGLWLQAASTMKDLCEARGIPYLEVIQPNQYFSKKVLTESERRIAINPESPYRVAVEEAYPKMSGQVSCLQEKGIIAWSAVELFDSSTEPVFSDDCCHYNQTGNEILAEAVASRIELLLSGSDVQAADGECFLGANVSQ